MDVTTREFNVGKTTYRIEAKLDSGGFGTVYLANPKEQGVWPTSPPLVAKVPASNLLEDEEWMRRFEREARILGNISHPNVVKTLGHLKYPDGVPVIIQEYVRDAIPFGQWTHSTITELVSVLLQILYALRATHGTSSDSRAIHRDLSPSNILITPPSVAKVIDFGLARERDRTTTVLTRSGRTFGTPGCIAPEQVDKSKNVDHRADFFALGRTIASCLQRRSPEFVETARLEPPLREIVEQLAAFEVDERFSDAESAICRILHDYLNVGTLPDQLELHFREFLSWTAAPDEWARVASAHFLGSPSLTSEDLRLPPLVNESVLRNPHFQVDLVFDRLSTGPLHSHFSSGAAAFEDCDPVGSFIATWYPYLSPSNRTAAFQQLCDIAMTYHRYHVMGCVRSAFKKETDPVVQAQLVATLNARDPSKEIHGHGVIPGR